MSERECIGKRVGFEWKRRFERYVTVGGRPWGDHRSWDGVCAAQFLLLNAIFSLYSTYRNHTNK